MGWKERRSAACCARCGHSLRILIRANGATLDQWLCIEPQVPMPICLVIHEMAADEAHHEISGGALCRRALDMLLNDGCRVEPTEVCENFTPSDEGGADGS